MAFFHPLGLALEVTVDDDGTEKPGGIWDYRDAPDGILLFQRPLPYGENQECSRIHQPET